MEWILIFAGIIWFVWKLIDEARWNTHIYDNTGIDIHKEFEDLCVKRISKSEYKKNYRNGKYHK